MKKYLLVIGILISLLAISVSVVFAAGTYRSDITVTDNSSVSREGVPVLIDFNSDGAVSLGLLSDNGTDTRVFEGTTERFYMVADDKLGIFIPELTTTQKRIYRFETGYTPANTSFGIITGTDGYITTTDNETIELSDNFTSELSGWVDTDNGTDKNLVFKLAAFKTYVSDSVSGNITASILGTAASANETLSPNGVGDFSNIPNITPDTGEEHYEDVNVLNDATYVESNVAVTVYKDTYEIEGTTIANTSVINTVTVYFRITGDAAAGDGARPILRLGTNETTGAWVDPAGGGFVEYNELLARPGGGAWMQGDLEGLQIGAEVRGAGAASCKMGRIYIVVNYSDEVEDASVSATGVSSGNMTVTTEAHGGEYTKLVDSGDTLNFPGDANSMVDTNAAYGGQAKFWVSARFKLDAPYSAGAPNAQAILGNFVNATNFFGFSLQTDGRIRYRFKTGGVTGCDVFSTQTSWNANQWYHVLTSFSDTAPAQRLIIDGGVPVTASNAAINMPAGNFAIGHYRTAPADANGFVGVIADVFLGTDDLTPAEETALYNGIPPADAVGVYSIDEGIGVTVIDYGTGGNDGTIAASPTWTTGSRYTDYYIDVDGDSWGVNLHGVSVPDNADDWVFGQNNVMPYIEYITIDVDGVEKLYYQPNDIISGTTLPDRTGNNDGTITWGANDELIVSVGGLRSIASYVSISTEEGEPPLVVPAPGDIPGFYPTEGDITDMPWYDLFLRAAAPLGWDTNTLYGVMGIFVGIGMGVGVAVATGSALLAALAVGIGLAVGAGTGTIGWWVVMVYGLMAGTFIVTSRSM